MRRVLSFDIDLTDKEWIPLKEKGDDISLPLCDKAWPVCAASIDILKRILKHFETFEGHQGWFEVEVGGQDHRSFEFHAVGSINEEPRCEFRRDWRHAGGATPKSR